MILSHAVSAGMGSWSIGGGAIVAPNPYKDTQVNVLGIPIVNYIVNTIHNSPMVSESRFNYSLLTGLTWEFGGREQAFNK